MPDFTSILKKKFKNSVEMCSNLLKETGVAVLPGVNFGFAPEKLIFRLAFVDFNGKDFLDHSKNKKKLDESDLIKFAPKVVEGIQKIITWSKKNT